MRLFCCICSISDGKCCKQTPHDVASDPGMQLLPMTLLRVSRPRDYKTFFILNSAEHEILNAYKYENIKKFSIFPAQISLGCYFSCS